MNWLLTFQLLYVYDVLMMSVLFSLFCLVFFFFLSGHVIVQHEWQISRPSFSRLWAIYISLKIFLNVKSFRFIKRHVTVTVITLVVMTPMTRWDNMYLGRSNDTFPWPHTEIIGSVLPDKSSDSLMFHFVWIWSCANCCLYWNKWCSSK